MSFRGNMIGGLVALGTVLGAAGAVSAQEEVVQCVGFTDKSVPGQIVVEAANACNAPMVVKVCVRGGEDDRAVVQADTVPANTIWTFQANTPPVGPTPSFAATACPVNAPCDAVCPAEAQ